MLKPVLSSSRCLTAKPLKIVMVLTTLALIGTGCSTPPPARHTVRTTPARPSLKPLPVKAINLQTECEFSDEESGYHVKTGIGITNSQVQRFHATFNIPERGSCAVDLSHFKQTRQRPQIDLSSQSGCKIMVWEQGNQVTIALDQCSAYCTPDTFDYIWPIIVDKQTGTCH